ncbi:MAG TPA: phosphohistidine phosphatase SixA [Magnetovibrio sp.]
MRLYLVRHGKAEFGPEDADRKLSERGISDVQAMARHLGGQGIRVERLIHSSLSRARETAEILGTAVAPGVPLTEMSGIEPWGDVHGFAEIVEDWDVDTMVCGHEPFMGSAASLLLAGSANADLVVVKTGTVMALEPAHYREGWQLRWMLTPRMVRGAKEDKNL